MEIIKMESIPLTQNKRGVGARHLLERDGVKVTNLVLNPGDEVPEHTAPVDVFFYVVSGKGRITVGGETAEVQATDIVPCPANTPMAVKAVGEKLVILNVKTPNPDSLEKHSSLAKRHYGCGSK